MRSGPLLVVAVGALTMVVPLTVIPTLRGDATIERPGEGRSCTPPGGTEAPDVSQPLVDDPGELATRPGPAGAPAGGPAGSGGLPPLPTTPPSPATPAGEPGAPTQHGGGAQPPTPGQPGDPGAGDAGTPAANPAAPSAGSAATAVSTTVPTTVPPTTVVLDEPPIEEDAPALPWWLVAVVVAAAAVAGLAGWISTRGRSDVSEGAGDGSAELAHARRVAATDPTGGLRAAFVGGLRRLDAAGLHPYDPSIPSGRISERLRHQGFDRAAAIFDDVFYGGRPARPDDVATVVASFDGVVGSTAATVQAR